MSKNYICKPCNLWERANPLSLEEACNLYFEKCERAWRGLNPFPTLYSLSDHKEYSVLIGGNWDNWSCVSECVCELSVNGYESCIIQVHGRTELCVLVEDRTMDLASEILDKWGN